MGIDFCNTTLLCEMYLETDSVRTAQVAVGEQPGSTEYLPEREREGGRERERLRERERARGRGRESVCLRERECVCWRERECDCVCVCV